MAESVDWLAGDPVELTFTPWPALAAVGQTRSDSPHGRPRNAVGEVSRHARGWPAATLAGICYKVRVMDRDRIRDRSEEFDLRGARLPDFYPADDVLAEIGRVAIAATRVDNQLALVLYAVKYPEPENPESLDRLRKWSTGRLAQQARKVLKCRFEGELLDVAVAAVDCAVERQEKRHACLHNLWMPEPHDTSFKVGVLAGLGSRDELDELVRERGKSAKYTTLFPRSGSPGPQEIAELDQIRADLEDSKNTLERLRFVLASALFAGSPAGAKKVLPLKYPNLRTEPGRSGWKGSDELLSSLTATQAQWRNEWPGGLHTLPTGRSRARFATHTHFDVPRLAVTLRRPALRSRHARP
jgi:hypothetical protein